jgi:hypothetical protein
MSWLRLVGALHLGLAMACCFPSKTPEEKAKEEAEEKAEEARKEAELNALAAALQKIQKDVSGFEPTAEALCDDARIKALHSTSTTSFTKDDPSMVREEALAAFAGGQPFAGAEDADAKVWGFMDDEWVTKLGRPLTSTSDYSRKSDKNWILDRANAKAGALVVWKPQERGWPKITSKGGMFTDGAFDGGYWVGSMVVYDLKSGDRLCVAVVEAESSDELTWDDGGVNKETPQGAADKDFKKNLEAAADKSLKAASPSLDLEM